MPRQTSFPRWLRVRSGRMAGLARALPCPTCSELGHALAQLRNLVDSCSPLSPHPHSAPFVQCRPRGHAPEAALSGATGWRRSRNPVALVAVPAICRRDSCRLARKRLPSRLAWHALSSFPGGCSGRLLWLPARPGRPAWPAHRWGALRPRTKRCAMLCRAPRACPNDCQAAPRHDSPSLSGTGGRAPGVHLQPVSRDCPRHPENWPFLPGLGMPAEFETARFGLRPGAARRDDWPPDAAFSTSLAI
mmetsp:Transcript_108104/g.258045  ORF Transcript_108104/g.258045 Transcript_108104/m.258045 type:complete len:247 (+) Transcript_108104:800-1540(+)